MLLGFATGVALTAAGSATTLGFGGTEGTVAGASDFSAVAAALTAGIGANRMLIAGVTAVGG